ncbi:unnamed protein product [Vitrella brassicaformis CCMP3155]|uniref:Uncharacterized protein n=1 Tax=Vitrella brassicaformis (strain CCMP3155) TaxID=1169540 RepID=A0A0G4GQA4_VITBC|nr:unnamed protein product [Vitrella brassicaformis CCMP3155]|eukprot:CEM32636.1 unnamed protein product [Vitrella brassicaformis CCMP3155]
MWDQTVRAAFNAALAELKQHATKSLMDYWREDGNAPHYEFPLDCVPDPSAFPYPSLIPGSKIARAVERRKLRMCDVAPPPGITPPLEAQAAALVGRALVELMSEHYLGDPHEMEIEIIAFSGGSTGTLKSLYDDESDFTLPWFARGSPMTVNEETISRTMAFDTSCNAATWRYIVSVSALSPWRDFNDLLEAKGDLRMATSVLGRAGVMETAFPDAQIIFERTLGLDAIFVQWLAGNFTGILADKSQLNAGTGIPRGFLDLLFVEVETGVAEQLCAYFPPPAWLCFDQSLNTTVFEQ